MSPPAVPPRPRFAAVPHVLKNLPFLLFHLAAIGVFFTGASLVDWIMCAVLYVVRMFGITAGYHRYFSHRTYKTTRFFQFVMAWLGCSAMQKGPLWWAAHHRGHHKHSDTEHDPHSPVVKTIWEAHVGWVMNKDNEATHWHLIKDFAKYRELVWLERWNWIPGILLGAAVFGLGWLIGGDLRHALGTLFCGFILSTICVYHGTFLINSLAHLWGSRRFETKDRSRNNFWLALVTLGEGWHNNHHHYQSSTRQGFYWWEVDFSYYGLKLLSVFGLVWGLREPPKRLFDEAAAAKTA